MNSFGTIVINGREIKFHQGKTTLYTDLFSRSGGLATFMALDHQGSAEVPDEEYP